MPIASWIRGGQKFQKQRPKTKADFRFHPLRKRSRNALQHVALSIESTLRVAALAAQSLVTRTFLAGGPDMGTYVA